MPQLLNNTGGWLFSFLFVKIPILFIKTLCYTITRGGCRVKKKNIIIVLSVIIVIVAFLGVYFITANKEDKNTNKDNNKTENKEKKKVNIIKHTLCMNLW